MAQQPNAEILGDAFIFEGAIGHFDVETNWLLGNGAKRRGFQLASMAKLVFHCTPIGALRTFSVSRSVEHYPKPSSTKTLQGDEPFTDSPGGKGPCLQTAYTPNDGISLEISETIRANPMSFELDSAMSIAQDRMAFLILAIAQIADQHRKLSLEMATIRGMRRELT